MERKQYSDMFFQLLRLSMGLAESTTFKMTAEGWQRLYRMARQQSLTGVLYTAVKKLSTEQLPPMELAMQWMSEAEAIKGMNELQNSEAERLTKLFGGVGRRTAILKGQANARLYPDKYARLPGDIDIWVEGGRENVSQLLITLGLLDEVPTAANVGLKDKATTSYHHIHLPPTKNGVIVEVHFRPSSGNFNPFTNRRLQRWLEGEIKQATMVEEGFCVPSMRFALMMQLSHIQRHFLRSGFGLRQICDYYWLLRNATEEDRQVVAGLMGKFGLRHTAEALMWVLGEVLHLDTELMLCRADSHRGEWMLREMMLGGNFGHYAQRQRQDMWRRIFESKQRGFRLMKFDFWEMLWGEIRFWEAVIQTLPNRIRRRSFSLAEANKRDAKKNENNKVL